MIVKCPAKIPGEQYHALVTDLHKQAQDDGLVVLPYFCDLLAVSEDMELQITQEKTEGTRVAALEKELAAAMAYISTDKDCRTCKHIMEPIMDDDCLGECEQCTGGPCKGICKNCVKGSNWEWRHTHGTE